MILILHPDGRVLPLDAVTNITVSNSAAVPRHPMEEGADVSENVHLANTEYILTCRVTESPTTSQVEREYAGYGITNVLKDKSGPERVQATGDFLKDCIGELVDIYSTTGRFVA